MSTKKTSVPKTRAKTAYGLLSAIRRLILAEPKCYDQEIYINRAGQENFSPADEYPFCNTVGCVAGWVVMLRHPHTTAKYNQIASRAKHILKLSGGAATELFHASAAFKPDPSSRTGQYRRTDPQTPEHARYGAAHIAKFQRKYRTQLLATTL